MTLGTDVDNPAGLIERAKALLPDAKEVSLIEYLEGGWSNRNYRIAVDGNEAVLRVKNQMFDDSPGENLYLANPLAPRLLAYDKNSGDMITEFVEGELLVNSPIDPTTAANYMLELHEHIPQKIRVYDVRKVIASYLKGLQMKVDLQQIYEGLDWQPQNICGCHNELNDWNVIKTDTGFCTLDWESAGDHDPIFDVVGLCYGLEFNDSQFRKCIKDYDSNVKPMHVRTTRIVYQIREHTWALDRLRHGSKHDGILKQKIDTESEILRLAAY